MIRSGEVVFIDTGAWIALALSQDALHLRACETWRQLQEAAVRPVTSIPIVLETFTFLERNVQRDVALAWKESLREVRRLRTLEVSNADLERAWAYFQRPDLHKLSAVDATSFVLMVRHKLRRAFTFDHHFASAGFQIVG